MFQLLTIKYKTNKENILTEDRVAGRKYEYVFIKNYRYCTVLSV